jgi:hypothetical protein
VKFSECMRENGVSDFPDPNASACLWDQREPNPRPTGDRTGQFGATGGDRLLRRSTPRVR